MEDPSENQKPILMPVESNNNNKKKGINECDNNTENIPLRSIVNANSNEKCETTEQDNTTTKEFNDASTTYLETIVHLFKGNMGSGLFAMADGFKNAGLLTGTVLTILLGIVCLHSQRLLVNCSKKMKERYNTDKCPDFAETVELCFQTGPPSLRCHAQYMRRTVNIFICLTQLGFCCIYFVFISASLKQVLDSYNIFISIQTYMLILLGPIIWTCMITNLKYLVPFTALASICISTGILLVMYYSCKDLPPLSERKSFSTWQQLPLYFGTAIFCFEGIALVLPLKNAMRKPKNFDKSLGVLNVGTTVVIGIFTMFGFIGYLRYGENVKGSITLNLPDDDILSQVVKLSTALGVLLGYSLQFHIPIQIMWPEIVRIYNIQSNLHTKELMFRALLVLATFIVAELIPNLVLLISLIGAFCSSALALMYPPLIDLVINLGCEAKPSYFLIGKNIFILMIGVLGFVTGTYESLAAIVKEFRL